MVAPGGPVQVPGGPVQVAPGGPVPSEEAGQEERPAQRHGAGFERVPRSLLPRFRICCARKINTEQGKGRLFR